jgi:glycosyltransferase involved in cell wall biosynthesis
MSLSAPLRIALVHPGLGVGAGSEARPIWLATALKETARVTLIVMGSIDLAALNTFFGADLRPKDVDFVFVSPPRGTRRRFAALRGRPIHRYIRKHRNDYDLWISTYNVMDFGVRGVQFIADFSFDDDLRRRFDKSAPGARGLLYRKSPLRSAYIWLGKRLAGQAKRGWMRNVTVANSQWSRTVLSRCYGLECPVIYPPVHVRPVASPWGGRENGFLVVGRIEPEKNLERIISILGRVRREGFNVHLHILGRIMKTPYVRMIATLCDQNREWASLDGLKGGQEKDEFLARHKFGLSGRQYEPFGIAVAEMVKAGCLVWVPDGGGQAEIVDNSALTFTDDDEAVAKITAVLRSEERQRELLAHLAVQAGKFSQERFMDEARSLLLPFLKG